ncbi:hypothetical protein N7501_011039 [Penicillium viridicatum]|nr:hypothetical protein N7501_011039 [Penicillium viridicatum]
MTMAINRSLSLAYEYQSSKSSPTTTRPALGDNLPISWEGSMELIKVVPCGSYEAAADRFVDVVKSTLESFARWVLR